MRLVPSRAHEALVELVRKQPLLVPEMLRGMLGVDLPGFARARMESGDLSQLQPTEFRADAVVALTDEHGNPVLAVVVEVQRSCDPGKRYAWPVYLTTLRSRLRCDTLLVVIAIDASIARWCAAAIPIGHPGWVLEPLVVGPRAIPLVTEPQRVEDKLWLVVLSSLAHHDHVQRDEVFRALLRSIGALDEDEASRYVDILMAGLPEVALRHLEALMGMENCPYISDFARHHWGQGFAEGVAEGEAKGEAKGEANAIITVLTSKGMRVPAAVRKRIMNCTDASQLTAWLERAVNARSVDDVFV